MKIIIANKSLLFLFLTILAIDATSEETQRAIEQHSGTLHFYFLALDQIRITH